MSLSYGPFFLRSGEQWWAEAEDAHNTARCARGSHEQCWVETHATQATVCTFMERMMSADRSLCFLREVEVMQVANPGGRTTIKHSRPLVWIEARRGTLKTNTGCACSRVEVRACALCRLRREALGSAPKVPALWLCSCPAPHHLMCCLIQPYRVALNARHGARVSMTNTDTKTKHSRKNTGRTTHQRTI